MLRQLIVSRYLKGAWGLTPPAPDPTCPYKICPGAFVIVDDYLGWPACQQAVSDFLSSRSLNPENRIIDREGPYWRVP